MLFGAFQLMFLAGSTAAIHAFLYNTIQAVRLPYLFVRARQPPYRDVF